MIRLVLAATLFFVACNNTKPEQDISIMPTKSADSSSSVKATPAIEAQTVNDMIASPQSVATPGTASSTVTTTLPGMNPPHGQPGHRCDIKEGAPLSSAPDRVATQPASVVTNAAPAVATAQPTTAAKTLTPKGMNPPHGEPGHRCDISVGAPLSSAPKATSATPNGTANITPMAAPTQGAPVAAALQNTNIAPAAKSGEAFTGKLNPAHGQPGHDCKVAVGQPLP